jgi:hypothetical protein
MFKGSVQEARNGGQGGMIRSSDMGFRIAGIAIGPVIGRQRWLFLAAFSLMAQTGGAGSR